MKTLRIFWPFDGIEGKSDYSLISHVTIFRYHVRGRQTFYNVAKYLSGLKHNIFAGDLSISNFFFFDNQDRIETFLCHATLPSLYHRCRILFKTYQIFLFKKSETW